MILNYTSIFRRLNSNYTNFNPFLQNIQFHKIPDDFFLDWWSITNSLTFYQMPCFEWKPNGGKRKDPGNIVIPSIILFPPSKLTDEKNRVVELSLLRKRLRYNAAKKRGLFRNVDPPVSIVATNYPNLLLNT